MHVSISVKPLFSSFQPVLTWSRNTKQASKQWPHGGQPAQPPTRHQRIHHGQSHRRFSPAPPCSRARAWLLPNVYKYIYIMIIYTAKRGRKRRLFCPAYSSAEGSCSSMPILAATSSRSGTWAASRWCGHGCAGEIFCNKTHLPEINFN